MTARRTLTVLGVTGAGKSTWIGALADGLYRGFVSRIVFDDEHWPDNTTWLDRARSYIQRGEYPRHTTRETHGVIDLPLLVHRGVKRGEGLALKISDYDGELIDNLFRERIEGWDDAWKRRARADGFLVLVRHDFTRGLRTLKKPKSGRAIARPAGADPMSAVAPEELVGDPVPDQSLPSADEVTDDHVRYVPTTLALVEMLQWIRHERGLLPAEPTPANAPLRVGVVLTGWDSVEPEYKLAPPERYLAAHHSLLNDFLRTNFRAEEVRVFALSATGGNLEDRAFRDRYLASETPLSTVRWTTGNEHVAQDSDLAVPLCWALFGEPGIAD